MLQIENLAFAYGNEVILKDLNFSVEAGKCLVIFGASGCGKTTLLHLIAGLKHPAQGKITYCGKTVNGPMPEISMIFQNYGLFPWKTVRQNLVLIDQIRKKKTDEAAFDQMVKTLGLEKHLDKYPAQLSGGQKQRVAIGRALLNQSKVILMDEPFSALDVEMKKSLHMFLKGLFEERNITVIMVTHSVDDALIWGDQIAVFKEHGVTFEKLIENPYKEQLSKRDAFMKTLWEEGR